jgi:hypothetical protein
MIRERRWPVAATAQAGPVAPGRIPFVLRVGVTGHRVLPADRLEGLRMELASALGRVRELFPPGDETPVVLSAVSALAEGADRLVAETVLATPGGGLEVALPLPASDYRQDFAGEASNREFDLLMERASLVLEAAASSSREEAYEKAGRYVVDRADVLIAIWDGEPSRGRGGTADIVRYALETRRPVLLVPARGGTVVVDTGDGPIPAALRPAGATRDPSGPAGEGALLPIDATRESLADLGRYNRLPRLLLWSCAALRPERIEAEISGETISLTPEAAGGLDGLPGWVRSYYVWADRRALFFQTWYGRGMRAQFLLAFLAVAVAALYAIVLKPHHVLVLLAELGFVALAVFIASTGRRRELHPQWLQSRFLAERFRSAMFLKAAGLGLRREGGFEGVNFADHSDDWLRRAYKYVWDHCPKPAAPAGLDSLRQLLVAGWIEPQIAYHQRKSEVQGRRHELVERASIAILVVVAVMVLVHIATGLRHWELPWLEDTAGLVGVTFPALAAAIAGIAAQRQYQRHAIVSARMARFLDLAKERIRQVSSAAELEAAAADVDDIMGDENRDWLGVMKFHDFELSG